MEQGVEELAAKGHEGAFQGDGNILYFIIVLITFTYTHVFVNTR